MLALVPRLLGEAAKDHPLPDEEIVRRVLAGEKALFEVLMRRHYHKVYRAVRSVLKDKVEDAMRQAYVFAYFHLAQFDGAARFSTWIIWIAVREAYAQLRRSRSIAKGGQYLLMRLPPDRSSAVIGRLPKSYEILTRGRRGVGAVLPLRVPRCERVVAAVFAAIQRIECKDAGGAPGANPVTIGVHP